MKIWGIVVALSLLAGCGRKDSSASKPEPKPFASDTLPTDAVERSGAICDRLVAAGVAKNCVHAKEPGPSKLHSAIIWPSSFEPVGGFAGDKCVARVYATQKDADAFAHDAKVAVPETDDYPDKSTFSTSAAMWQASVSCGEDSKSNRWEKCREKLPVATCVKQTPAEYAKYKALHDASVRILDGLK